jgi:hypothetical protein
MQLPATKLHRVKASAWKQTPEHIRQRMLPGAVPINDALYDLWGNEFEIALLYGSYGSGKSVFIVDDLIQHAKHDEYFRCFFGRKILDTVRGTVFQTVIDRIRELKLESQFKFSDAPNSSMVITCRKNGNSFYPFGSNNPASLKSIKDPTHFFLEEMDQFTFEDFGFIYSRLRTEKAKTKLYGAFNTERIYQSHWLRKVFFDGEFKDQSFKLKVNYTDNYFIDQEAYYKKLQLIANGNAAVLNAIANGEWGVVRTGSEFLKSFDETKHVKKVQYSPGVVYASLDENVNPYVTNTIWQIRGKQILQVHEILAQSPDNNAPKAAAKFADWLDGIGHKDAVFVCGDPSASKRSTVDENSSSFYVKFIEVLTKRGYKVINKVQKSAPEVALSGAFFNALLEGNVNGWEILISDRCFSSIEDYIMTKEDAEGRPFPEKKTHPETKIPYETRGHVLDAARYLIVLVLHTEFEAYKGRKKSNLSSKISYFK